MPFGFSHNRAIACDLGTSEYYRIAWLLTRKYGRSDLGLLHNLAQSQAQGNIDAPCAGARAVSRIWRSVWDPRAGAPVGEFTVCAPCAKAVEVLLPGLTGVFVALDTPAEAVVGVCALHQGSGNSGAGEDRFLLYFDMFEGAADRALEKGVAPDVQALADRIRGLASVPPCAGGRILRNSLWHTMRGVPGFVVCPECFLVVVRPLLGGVEAEGEEEGDPGDALAVAGNFHHAPVRLPEAECMLFSDRMRGVFDRAVRRRDLGYLDAKVRERMAKEQECDGRLKALRRMGLDAASLKAETRLVYQEWRRYE